MVWPLSGRASRVSGYRLIRGRRVLLLERGAVPKRARTGVRIAPVVAGVDTVAEPIAAEDAGVPEVPAEGLQLAAGQRQLGADDFAGQWEW